MAGDPFSGLFVPGAIAEPTSGDAWLAAMLEVEASFAEAEAEAGLIPGEAAKAIRAACDTGGFDVDRLSREGRASANPVVPLVAELREKVGGDAAAFVHHGATSQDVMDSAAMLVANRALGVIRPELDGAAATCAELAERHRETPMAGRTLLQQALPVTFGLKAAIWLDSLVSARERLDSVSLAVQLGGPTGTLASLGPGGERVLGLLADRLGLEEPAVPWHAIRGRIADLGASLAITAGALEKIALDVVLLSQTEVGEVTESSGEGRGGSSSMPHKRNPAGSVVAIACARRVRGDAGVLLAAMPQELERAAGAWQSEWGPLSDALALTGGAAAAMRDALDGLEVRPERMRENLELLLAQVGKPELADDLGSSGAFVDRALSRYGEGP